MKYVLFTLFGLFACIYCFKTSTPLPSSSISSSFTLKFQEDSTNAGLSYSHSDPDFGNFDENMYHSMAGGLAAGDVDNDGDIDLFLVGGKNGTNHLLLNDGSGNFLDQTSAYGLSSSNRSDSGPAFIDFDGDGDLDLIVGNIGEKSVDTIRVYRNDGTSFTDITTSAGISYPVGNCPSTESDCIDTYNVSVGDINNDGFLDVYTGHWNRPTTTFYQKGFFLWKNNGNSTFTDVTATYGLSSELLTFTAAFADLDGNLYKDLILANDFNNQKVYLNNGSTPLTDSGLSFPGWNAMGVAAGDIDNDGDLDWMFTHIYDPDTNSKYMGNRLWRNNGSNSFTDISASAGIANGSWGWGICFADFDNDTDLDIFHVNGMVSPSYNDASVLFINDGTGVFTEKANEVGIQDNGQGRGVVCFDADRDGDIDIVVFNNNGPYRFYRNISTGNHNWLTVKLRYPASKNRFGIGAKIILQIEGKSFRRDITADNHYAGQNPPEAHFGLGLLSGTATISITWPDGTTSSHSGINLNQTITITHP
ncbi:MAG: CRTAC1 family protein [Candidatus Hydrogenedentota bacterium]|nr:MAG: CRTAC1 family protein [Candidatus Hydrogenedentota bacterium]